jgi:hypothetical protein
MAEAIDQSAAKPPATAGDEPPAKLTWDELQALVKRAQKGDQKALPKLREALTSGDFPEWSLWFRDCLGNPAVWLRDALARKVAGENLAILEATKLAMDKIRQDLEGPAPTAMERLWRSGPPSVGSWSVFTRRCTPN